MTGSAGLSELDHHVQRTLEFVLSFGSQYRLLIEEDAAKRHAKAEVMATFASLCGPAVPDQAGTLLAARFLTIFFFLDDLKRNDLYEQTDEMLSTLRAPDSPLTLLPARALAAYLDELARCGDTRLFRQKFEQGLQALREEADLLERGRLSVASYRDIRVRTIFVEQYLCTWLLSERIAVDAAELERTNQLQRLASECIYLVNDIGSVEWERSGRDDSNLVLLVEREQGLSTDRASQVVRAMHDEAASAFGREASQLCGPAESPALRRIVELLVGFMRGNLTTTRRLSSVRYPGSERALERLRDYAEVAG
jgi:hypothetical protein